MYCFKCGFQVSDQVAYCPRCGQNLQGIAAAVAGGTALVIPKEPSVPQGAAAPSMIVSMQKGQEFKAKSFHIGYLENTPEDFRFEVTVRVKHNWITFENRERGLEVNVQTRLITQVNAQDETTGGFVRQKKYYYVIKMKERGQTIYYDKFYTIHFHTPGDRNVAYEAIMSVTG